MRFKQLDRKKDNIVEIKRVICLEALLVLGVDAGALLLVKIARRLL